jgi:xanthine phosphoribosyltransferase
MKLLEERIRKDGEVLPGNVIKVDSFLNHQIDTELISKCGEEWYEMFKDAGVTKILTIDGSGIGIACLVARHFNVPVLFAKKSGATNKVGDDFYSTTVVSFTHGHEYNVVAKKKFISKDDRILIIDDFLANGSAMRALISLVKVAGATVVGCGAAVEKVYQGGGEYIRRLGYRVESLAKISSLSDDGNIEFC